MNCVLGGFDVMINEIKWVFIDIGSTLVDEYFVSEYIVRDIADQTNKSYFIFERM